jgi:hypothetical protein
MESGFLNRKLLFVYRLQQFYFNKELNLFKVESIDPIIVVVA